MKFLEKHKKFISRVLVVTVSLMLLLSSFPTSAAINSSSTLNSQQCSFIRAEVNGNQVYGTSKGYRFNFYGHTGSLSGTHNFTAYLQNPIYITASTVPKKVIQFVVDVPGLLDDSFKDGFFVSFSTSFGKYIRLNCNSIWYNHDISGTTLYEKSFGSISRYVFYVDSSRLTRMYNDLGSFSITGLEVHVSSELCQQYLGFQNYIYIGDFYDCETMTVIDESAKMIADALQPIFSWLGGFFADAFTYVVNTFLVPVLNTLGFILNDIYNNLSPIFSSLFSDLILPVLDSILSSLSSVAGSIASSLSPLISNIVKDFTPIFNQLSNIITDNFLKLSNVLNPILNDFILNISPSFDSIVTNLSENISLIVNECFIPDNSSEQVQEFLSIKNDLTNKVPIFTQLSSFLETLFNPDTYYSSSSVNEKTYLDIGFVGNYYRFGKPLKPGDYKLVFNCHSTANLSSYPKLTLQAYDNVKKKWINIFSYSNYVRSGNVVYFSISNLYDYEIYELKLLHSYGIHKTTLYSLDNTILSSNVVNYKGTLINAFNFDWYKPYKKYGDICIIAFCYLVFIWRTFKRLPILI